MSDASVAYELIKEIFLLLDDGDRQLLERYGLTVPRFYALIHLGNEAGMSPNRLSELMFCDKSNITRLIKSMETEGLVMRRRHESDGRSVRLYLTNFGEETRQKAIESHAFYNDQRFGHGILREVNGLKDALVKLKTNLQLELQELHSHPP